MAVVSNPLLRSLTLTDANTVYNLLTLIRAVTTPDLSAYPNRCAHLRIQADPAGGAAKFYIGNADTLSATDFGVQLVATQVYEIGPVENNLILLDQIGLLCDTAAKTVEVSVLQR